METDRLPECPGNDNHHSRPSDGKENDEEYVAHPRPRGYNHGRSVGVWTGGPEWNHWKLRAGFLQRAQFQRSSVPQPNVRRDFRYVALRNVPIAILGDVAWVRLVVPDVLADPVLLVHVAEVK